MNTTSSKQHQVMSEENHQNEPDAKKRKLEDVHQTSLSTNKIFSNSKSNGFVICCQKTSLEKFDDKNLQTFYNFATSGKIFQLILQLIL